MRAIALLIVSMFAQAASAQILPLRDGDIVFQTSRSSQSMAVQEATGSRYSHMGIVFIRNGKPFVYEAAGKVQYTPLKKWAARGVGSQLLAKRLKNANEVLDAKAVKKLRVAADEFEGKPYDPTFEWSDSRIYCSELVWKIYQRGLGIELGELQKIREFNLRSQAVRQKMHERYGSHVPLDEPVISPVAVFNSPRLVTLGEH
jgi:uncharacterized protein YycO